MQTNPDCVMCTVEFFDALNHAPSPTAPDLSHGPQKAVVTALTVCQVHAMQVGRLMLMMCQEAKIAAFPEEVRT